jgi:hypothetical protein
MYLCVLQDVLGRKIIPISSRKQGRKGDVEAPQSPLQSENAAADSGLPETPGSEQSLRSEMPLKTKTPGSTSSSKSSMKASPRAKDHAPAEETKSTSNKF